jgi:hypothetical protein
MQMDGETDTVKLTVALRNFANTPKNSKRTFWNRWVETTHA